MEDVATLEQERIFLLRHLLVSPPAHLKIKLPVAAVDPVSELDLRALRIPLQLIKHTAGEQPYEWDLTNAKKLVSVKRSKREKSSVFHRGWSMFAQRFPLRRLPPYAEVLLRQADHNQQAGPHSPTKLLQSSDSSTSAFLLAHTVGATTLRQPSMIHRRRTSSPKHFLVDDEVTASQAVSIAALLQSRRTKSNADEEPLSKYPETPTIETCPVAQCHLMDALQTDTEALHVFVYEHILLAASLFLHHRASNLASAVLNVFRPALGVSDAQHKSSMLKLATAEQRPLLELSTSPEALKFESVVLDNTNNGIPLVTMALWRRVVAEAASPSPRQRSEEESPAAKLVALSHAASDGSLPPTAAALILATALQCTLTSSLDREAAKTPSHPAAVGDVIVLLQKALGLDDDVVPFCRIHALMLAQRSLLCIQSSQSKSTLIQTNFFSSLVEMLPFLVVSGIEDAPLEGTVLYKVFVLQEVVETSLALVQWLEALDDDTLCTSICQAFCATCTAVPPAFLSVYISCNGVPLRATAKAPDSALMELLSHFVGAALLRELGDPEDWLDPSKPVTTLLALADASNEQPLRFVKIFSEILPQADALVVPMLVRIASYLFGLFWGRSAKEAASSTMPDQFLEGTRAFYFRVAYRLPDDVKCCLAVMELVKDAVTTYLSWMQPLYERHINCTAEETNELLADVCARNWGADDESNVLALQRVFDKLLEAMIPLHFAVLVNMDAVFQRFLVVAVSTVGKLAQHICGPLLLTPVEVMERDAPEAFVPKGVTLVPPSTPMSCYPLKLGVCKQCVVRAGKLKPTVQGFSQLEALSRLKYLHTLRRNLQTLVETFYASVWLSALFKGSPKRSMQASASSRSLDASVGASAEVSVSAALRSPTIQVLKSLVEEALGNMQRFCSSIAETVALKIVHYGALHQDIQDKLLKIDLKFYRQYKHDKKFLMAEGKNAAMKPLYPSFTMEHVLDHIVKELHLLMQYVDTPETVVRINAHIYAHLASIFAFILLDGGDERFYYPEQSTALAADLTLIENFFTKNVPDLTDDSDKDDDEVESLWSVLTARDAVESSRWWERGNFVVDSLRTILSTVFPMSSEDLLNGTETSLPYNSLKEISEESAWCRFVVRRILLHRKDAAAKKFARSVA